MSSGIVREGGPHEIGEVEGAAEVLGIQQVQVYALVRSGIIPAGACFRLGRRLRFIRPRLVAWRDAGGAGFAGGWRREPRRPVTA